MMPAASLGPVWAIASKDVLLELRNKEIVLAILIFSFLVLIIFNFAVALTPTSAGVVGPGVLWVAIMFAAVIGLNRSFVIEKDGDALTGLMLTPVSRDTLLIGKALGNFLFMLVAEAIILPSFTALFNVNVLRPEIVVIAFITTLGLSTVGTLFAAISVNTRAREIMLPLLFLPVVVPLLIAAVEGTVQVVEGGSWSGAATWMQVGAAFDVVFVIVSVLTFQFILED